MKQNKKELALLLGHLMLNYKFNLKNQNTQIKTRYDHTIKVVPEIPVFVEKRIR